jgi:hypothetical protein
MQAQQFLHTVLTSETAQQAMKAALLDKGMLTFEVWQQVAAQAGYRFTEAEFEAVFAQEPELVDKLWALADAHDIQVEVDEFELNDAELHMIAGGGNAGCGGNDTRSVAGPGHIQIASNVISIYKGL